MSGIVIRCPHCGTTQSAIGECEACHEATTRWFCPNHEPGLWLDAALCPTCGARPGVPGTRPRPTPTRPRTPTPSRSTRPPPRDAPPPRRAPEREEFYPPETADAEPEVWSGPVYSSGDPRNRDPRFGDVPDAWRIDPSVMLPTAVRVVSLFGCLRRLVMIAIFLLVLFAIAFFGLFGGFVLGGEPAQPEPGGELGVSVTQPGSAG